MAAKSPDAFRTISEVADWLDRPAHVLRFWESKFPQVKPVKRAGGRRYYRPDDMLLLGGIKKLLHDDGMTIKGVQKLLREQGVRHVCALSQPLDDVADAITAEADGAAPVRPAEVIAPADPARPPVRPPVATQAPQTAADTQEDAAPDVAAPETDVQSAPETMAETQTETLPEPLAEPAAPRPLGADLPPPPDLAAIQPETGVLGLIAARRPGATPLDRVALGAVLARIDDLAARIGTARKG